MDLLHAVSVVVASHGRPSRLRWLLNALEDQEFTEPWELVVVHDYDEETQRRVLDTHPLADRGVLRQISIEPGTGSPARQRNLGWRAARGELVAFTDDDCRPEPEWLGRLVQVALSAPHAVVQGRTRPDPLEAAILAAPHVRTLAIDPVGLYGQTCNILYRREQLALLGGFDERAITGEDVDLMLRARAAGHPVAAAPEAIVNHAVESHTLPGILRQNLKWRHLAYLVKQHPELRRQMAGVICWDDEHLRTALALAGALGAKRHPVFSLAAMPYVVHGLNRRGGGLRGRAVAVAELPGQAIRQAAEVVGLAVGSLRHRTLAL